MVRCLLFASIQILIGFVFFFGGGELYTVSPRTTLRGVDSSIVFANYLLTYVVVSFLGFGRLCAVYFCVTTRTIQE